jgi:fructose-bisphosphate aldolase class II
MKDIAVARYEAFGTAGNAPKIVPLGLEAMTYGYVSGELDSKIKPFASQTIGLDIHPNRV